jgi:hypothetical protein
VKNFYVIAMSIAILMIGIVIALFMACVLVTQIITKIQQPIIVSVLTKYQFGHGFGSSLLFLFVLRLALLIGLDVEEC